VSGGFVNSSGGTVAIDIGGTLTSQFGSVMVSGAATLSGTLNLNLVNGFTPTLGNTFQVMTFDSRAGQFGTINGLVIGNGNQFTPVYESTDLTLNVTAASLPAALVQSGTDSDGDGVLDLQEAIAGTDPLDGSSAFRVSGVLVSGSDVTVEFPSVAGRTYAVECSTDLRGDSWAVIKGAIPGTGQPVIFIDKGANTRLSRCFYRVRVTTP
jgi:hypothetical protein